jgi:hypothetical protein
MSIVLLRQAKDKRTRIEKPSIIWIVFVGIYSTKLKIENCK